ncbi:MAG: hypothetical protein HY040_20815 [Planctomycetes bacterium]|nr:hypothetical protein [Planctomycetota bacterium]
MKSSEVVKWKEKDWKSKIIYAMPSDGGAVGVVFVWTAPPGPKPKIPTAAFVIKPIQGTAAPTKFAEYLLRKVAGAVSPHSKGIAHSTKDDRTTGKFIEESLKSCKDKEKDATIKQRWDVVWPHLASAESYLIQDVQEGIKEFGDEYRKTWGLSTLLMDMKLMESLGKLFVADAMIGNGDRLCTPNTGNIVFKKDGTLCLIDSSAVLTNYKATLDDISQSAWVSTETTMTPQVWTKGVINTGTNAVASPTQQGDYGKGYSPKVGPSFPMETLFEPHVWWDKVFRPHLEHGLQVAKTHDPDIVEDTWQRAKEAFLGGVAVGEDEIERELFGLHWLMVKVKYKIYVHKYGGDPNVDWTNFKVRRLYFKLRRNGMKPNEAMKKVNEYVGKKIAS